ncbi:MAG: molybdopterin-guanine dinucleotide biosynthesis protein B [Actinobacteria bacterium]|nr:MAG: molybdopterin-guanine dinucleotide biosynthesis protein B [Actinomycetota bacterium]
MSGGTGIPVVSVVGKSDSGKTTLMEGLIRALTSRGWRVATCKHHVHEVDIDQPGKDSWRHARAGSRVTMISSPTQFAVVRAVDAERSLDEIAAEAGAGGCDVLLTEGFKRAGNVRIEVSRMARSDEMISEPEELFALVTDNPDLHPEGVPLFGLGDATALAVLIEECFLGDARDVQGEPRDGD